MQDFNKRGGATYSPILRSDGCTKSKCGMYLRNTLVSNIFKSVWWLDLLVRELYTTEIYNLLIRELYTTEI
jgi:hypothetical protein